MEQLRQGTSIQRIVSATAPTERADGTSLSTNEISHYNWFMSLDGGTVQLVGATQLVGGSFTDVIDVDNVSTGVWDIHYTTVDTQGLESAESPHLVLEVLPAFLAAPNPPSNVS